jgi:hypothetical protein
MKLGIDFRRSREEKEAFSGGSKTVVLFGVLGLSEVLRILRTASRLGVRMAWVGGTPSLGSDRDRRNTTGQESSL